MERECECLKRNVELLKRSVTCVWAATPAARQLSSVAADGLIRSTLLKGLGSCSSRAETSCKDVTTSPQAEEAPRARAAPPRCMHPATTPETHQSGPKPPRPGQIPRLEAEHPQNPLKELRQNYLPFQKNRNFTEVLKVW